MEVVLDVLVVILWILGILLAIILLVPIQFRAEARVDDDDMMALAELRWGYFLFLVRGRPTTGIDARLLGLSVGSSARRKQKRREKKKKKEQEAKPAREKKPGRGPGWAWQNRRVIGYAVRRILRAFHLKGRVAGIIGLGEPDQMAWVHQGVMVAEAVLPRGAVAVRCDYVDEEIALHARVGGWVWPVHLLGVFVALFFNRDVRRALKRPKPARRSATPPTETDVKGVTS